MGPGIVAVGVPAKATKSRKPSPSKQFATRVAVVERDRDRVAGLEHRGRRADREVAGDAAAEPDGDLGRLPALNVVASMNGIAAPAGTAGEHDAAERGDHRQGRDRS